MKTWSKL